MTVYILGGGPAGLALADALAEAGGPRFVLVERDNQLGGLARTLEWENRGAHDLGPHKIFSLDQALTARVRSLLPADGWITRPKASRIYMRGHMLPYPPSPLSLGKVFGWAPFVGMVWDYGWARIRSLLGRAAPRTFEEDLAGRVGRGLYEALFKPIALKLWGDPVNLDVKLSAGRVQTPPLMELIARTLGLSKKSQFEALEFEYPKGGLQRIWDAIHRKAQPHGEFLLGTEVTKIEVAGGRIARLGLRDRAGGAERVIDLGPDDFVMSSIPLGRLLVLMGDAVDNGVRERAADVLRLNDLILVFLHVDTPSLFEDSWIFVPDPAVVFHRISEQESFDPGMTGNGSIVCCEVMDNETRPMMELADEELVKRVEEGLRSMGYRFDAGASRVIRLRSSYPVFRPGFEGALTDVLATLDSIGNFRTLGRQGAFNYIGTLDAMDIGYGAARWYLARKPGAPDGWQSERERTRHYPVLD
ncbi:MAG: FAD-dependent oxidoreductase [Lysobacter sp.]|nr:FAD-dependent oxidoreductase [Lysobacter sp.]